MPVEGGQGRSLILNGHIDVVSPEPLSQWGDREPFGAEREDGWLHGRGAADMKCGWPPSSAPSVACGSWG